MHYNYCLGWIKVSHSPHPVDETLHVYSTTHLTLTTELLSYLLPQHISGVTDPTITESAYSHPSHHHHHWTTDTSGSMTPSLIRPFHWTVNRFTGLAPVLGRGRADLFWAPGTGGGGGVDGADYDSSHQNTSKHFNLGLSCKQWLQLLIELHPNHVSP